MLRLRQLAPNDDGHESDGDAADEYARLSKSELVTRLDNVKKALLRQNELNAQLRKDLQKSRQNVEAHEIRPDADGECVCDYSAVS